MPIKLMAKFCSVAAMVLLVIFALGPANWQPRTELGWRTDHFLGYFAITLMFCIAWRRPFVVGGALMAAAALLEGLQALTPDPLVQSFGCIMWCRRGVGGGSAG
jgi:VanZ family protein